MRQKHKALFNHFSGIFTENNQQEYPWKVILRRHLNFAVLTLLTCYSSFLCCTYVFAELLFVSKKPINEHFSHSLEGDQAF